MAENMISLLDGWLSKLMALIRPSLSDVGTAFLGMAAIVMARAIPFQFEVVMKINGLVKILVAAMLVIVVAPACLAGDRTPTPIPPPTPTPVTEQEIYARIERLATMRPAAFDRWLDEKSVVRFRGTVTNTEIGVIQFHLIKQIGNFDKYIECKMSVPQDAEKVNVGDIIVVQGHLKDAFNEKKRFGNLLGARNNNVIELEKCTIQ